MIGEFFGFAPSVVDNMKQCLVLASVLNNFCRKRYSLKLIDFYYIGTWQLAACSVCRAFCFSQSDEFSMPERIYNSHYSNGVPAMFTS